MQNPGSSKTCQILDQLKAAFWPTAGQWIARPRRWCRHIGGLYVSTYLYLYISEYFYIIYDVFIYWFIYTWVYTWLFVGLIHVQNNVFSLLSSLPPLSFSPDFHGNAKGNLGEGESPIMGVAKLLRLVAASSIYPTPN